MDNEDSNAGVARTTAAPLQEHTFSTTPQLIDALIRAWIVALIAGVVVFCIAFTTILIPGVIAGRSSLILPLYVLVYFVIAYATVGPIYAAFQTVLFGLPAALIGRRFNLLQLRTCILAGALLSSFPWSLICMLLATAASPGSDGSLSAQLYYGAGLFVALAVCGGAGGWAFWRSLRRPGPPGIQKTD